MILKKWSSHHNDYLQAIGDLVGGSISLKQPSEELLMSARYSVTLVISVWIQIHIYKTGVFGTWYKSVCIVYLVAMYKEFGMLYSKPS